MYIASEDTRRLLQRRIMTRNSFLGCVACCAALFAHLSGCAGKSTGDTPIPQAEVNRQNPVAINPESLAAGKRLYGATDCAMCHGIQGDGRGVLAKDTPMKTHDWRDTASLEHFTDGELFYIIANGKGRMPVYSKRESAEQTWQIVDYLRSFSAISPPLR
jgi:mono/diheme cytochrome c family protein